MFKIENNRDYFYQWDSNQRLVVEDNTITHVHYCNRTAEEAMVVEVYDDGAKRVADVPNILLQDVWSICAYGFCGSCYTKQHKVFKVIERSRPASYIYTETEVLRWETLEEELRAEMEALSSNISDELDRTRQEIYAELREAEAHYANAIKGSVKDTAARISDISPLPHNIKITTAPNAEVKIWDSKNIFDVSSIKGKTVSAYGGTLSCGEDGGITGSGTPTNSVALKSWRIDDLPNELMTFSAHGTFTNLAAVIYLRDKDGNTLTYYGVSTERRSISIKPYEYPNFSHATVEVKRSGNNYEMSGTMYLQLEIGSKSDYEPATTPTTYIAHWDGAIGDIEHTYPSLTFVSDSEVTVEYNRDATAVIEQLTQAIISLGGNV